MESIFILTEALKVSATNTVYACAVCFGASEDSTLIALRLGIFMLLGVVGAVLGGIVAFFIQIKRRSKHLVSLTAK